MCVAGQSQENIAHGGCQGHSRLGEPERHLRHRRREETLRSMEEQAETSPKGGFQYHRNQECIENLKDLASSS